jgi:hypothetical protein
VDRVEPRTISVVLKDSCHRYKVVQALKFLLGRLRLLLCDYYLLALRFHGMS